MAQTITVNGVSRGGVIGRKRVEWAESAYLGEVRTGKFVVDDTSGAIVIPGHKPVIVEQSSSTPARLFTGFTRRKGIRRGETFAGAIPPEAREIEVTTVDLNDLLRRHVIYVRSGDTDEEGGIRPAETVDDRIQWLLASGFLDAADFGAVAVSTLDMSDTDYRSRYPGDVLADCAKAAKFNYYLRYNATEDAVELVFRDDNASIADTSTIAISNDGSEVDGETVFAPQMDTELDQDPEHVYSGAYAAYAKSAVYVDRAATAAAFADRDGVTEDSGTKTATIATRDAEAFLSQSRDEEQNLPVTLRMRADQVNLILPGQRVPVRMLHMAPEGWDPARYARVLRRHVTQPLGTDEDYEVALTLSPQELCEDVDDFYPLTGTITAGNSGAGTQAPDNPTNGNDGDDLTYVNFHAGGDGTGDEKLRWITLDHGSAIALFKFVLLCDQNVAVPDDWPNRLATPTTPSPPNEYTRFQYSNDNSTYTTINVTLTARDGNTPELQTYSFDDGEITARYWRILMGGKGGYGGDENIWHGGTLYEWGGSSRVCS